MVHFFWFVCDFLFASLEANALKGEDWLPDRANSRERTYAMITYVSKENNLGPGDKIRYIWGLKGLIL